MIAPTVIARVDQALQWAQKEHPTALPVQVVWRDRLGVTAKDRTGYWAETYREGQQLVILMARRRLRQYEIALDTFLHEYAHALTWPRARLEHATRPHGPDWWVAYGMLYEAWHDDCGWEHAREYRWRRRD